MNTISKTLEGSVVDGRFLISEEEFNDLLVDFSKSVNSMQESIDHWLIEDTIKYIFVQGKAGTGKSTWLYYYTKQEKLNDIDVQFVTVNMNKEKTGTSRAALVQDNLLPKLLNEVEKQLFDFKEDIEAIVENGRKSLLQCFIHDGYREKKRDQFIGFLNNFYLEGQQTDIKVKSYDDIVHQQVKEGDKEYLYKEQDLINIYLILKYITLRKTGKKIIFCFDNLDSFEQTFLGVKFLGGILDINTYMEKLFQDVFNNPHFNLDTKYIMCLRGININLMKTIGIETPDRINSVKEEIEFDNKSKAYDIIKRRLEIIERDNIGTPEKRKIFNSFNDTEKETYNKMIPSLFNQNCRGMLTNIYKIVDFGQSYTIKYEWITDIENTRFNNSTFAIRGILLSSILQYFQKDSGRKNIWKNLLKPQISNKSEAYCDQKRMIMTLISNLYIDNEENAMSLSSILDEINKYDYIKNIELKNFIKNSYEYDNDNSLLMIGNDSDVFIEMNDDIMSAIEDSKLKVEKNKLLKSAKEKILNFVDNYNNSEDEYKIDISDAILACIEHVYIHYEFYNYCRTQPHINSKKSSIPLFATIAKDKEDNIYPPKSFETQTESVYKFTELKLQNMKNFFCRSICKNKCNHEDIKKCNKEAVANFKRSNIVFKRANRTLHATRIINNHITYIDVFREYLLNYNFNNMNNNVLLDFHRKAQTYLINHIEKYVKLFFDYSHDSIFDESHIEIFEQIKTNIDRTRNELENYIVDKSKFVKIRRES